MCVYYIDDGDSYATCIYVYVYMWAMYYNNDGDSIYLSLYIFYYAHIEWARKDGPFPIN